MFALSYRLIDFRFLLARLHVNSLIGKGTARALRNALKSLPIGSNAYDSAYKAAMERIQGQVRDQVDMAQQVLSWITCAKRPLTMVELQNALAVDIGEPYLDEENLPDEEDIISACRGLVTVDERSNMVRLIHYTTKEYFVRTWTDWFPVAHQVIADTCLTYLSFEVFQSMPYRIGVNMRAHLEEYPLYRYSACYWGIHMRERHGNTALCRRFLMNSVKVATFNDVFIFEMSRTQKGWHRIYYLQGMTGIHFAAYFGLVCMVQELIKFGIAADTRSTDGKTPLSFAAMEGHKLTVMLLLKEGANPNTKDIKGQTPLMLTIRNHDKSVMRLHLERFDDIENKDKTGQTPLFTASMTEYESVVRLLLEKGANIEAQDKIGQTPLFAASMTKLESVVGFLLASGAYIETRDNTGQTPLFAASAAAHVSVVELLLQKGADIEARDHAGQTPLFAASTAEHESVVRLLLAKGADLEARDDRGRTALFAASAWARSSVIKLLVMQGADLRVRNIDGMTALSEAIENCQPSAVQTLLILSGNFLAHETLPTTLVWKKDAASLNAVLRNMGLAEHMEFFRISHTLCRIRVTAAWLYITLSTRKPD